MLLWVLSAGIFSAGTVGFVMMLQRVEACEEALCRLKKDLAPQEHIRLDTWNKQATVGDDWMEVV